MDREQEWASMIKNAQWVSTTGGAKGETMRAKVDENLCTGCGLCVELCPEVFEMGDDDLAKIRVIAVPEHAEASCEDAMQSCPVEAISIQK